LLRKRYCLAYHKPAPYIPVYIGKESVYIRHGGFGRYRPGYKWSVASHPTQVANPSFSHSSLHQSMVTKFPNHWCASSGCRYDVRAGLNLPIAYNTYREQQRTRPCTCTSHPSSPRRTRRLWCGMSPGPSFPWRRETRDTGVWMSNGIFKNCMTAIGFTYKLVNCKQVRLWKRVIDVENLMHVSHANLYVAIRKWRV
jgi:hypothetical protein